MRLEMRTDAVPRLRGMAHKLDQHGRQVLDLGRKRDGRTDAQTRDVLKAYMDDQARAIEQDFAIWENKIYRPDPPLCDGDGPVLAYRKWAGQFYSGAEAPASA